ncbi:MAG: hypothetical protein AB1779_12125 [Candidatus Thermoplasmatota archaeon]
MRALQQLIWIIGKYLNENELFYAYTGKFSLQLYGIHTPFTDLDILLNVTDDDREKLKRYLLREGFEKESETKKILCLVDKESRYKFFFKYALEKFELQTISRRIKLDYFYTTIYVSSVEDLIFSELFCGNEDNALTLYKGWRSHLDISYMLKSAQEMNFYKKFVKLRIKGDRGL